MYILLTKRREVRIVGKTYNKHEIVRRVVERLLDTKITIGGNKEFYKRKYNLKYSQEIVDNVISAFLEDLVDALENGDAVAFDGYMSIKPTYSAERMGRNVYANDKQNIVIPAQYRVKIKAGKRLKDACKRFSEKVLAENNVSDVKSDPENEN